MSSKEYLKFKCTVDRKVYENGDFKIYGMNADTNEYQFLKLNQYGNISICGDIPNLIPETEYEVTATEKQSQYGTSYHVVSIRRSAPLSKDGVRNFLCGVLTDNQAYVLVENYPDIMERVKDNRLDDIDLSKLYGIGEITFEKVVKKIKDNLDISDLVAEFEDIISLAMMEKLYSKYKSVDMLKEKLYKEPYSTLTNVSGIGFKKADEIVLAIQEHGAIDFGYDVRTSVDRCKECIEYLLKENEKNGDTKANLIDIRKQVIKLAPSCADKFAKAIVDDYIWYNKDTLEIALRRTREKERYIAKRIVDGIKTDNAWRCDVKKYKKVGNIELSDEQLSIVDAVCANTVVILNGPAGSGKSQSTKAVIDMLEDIEKSYLLLGSTGKSSKILADFTGRKASTVHRGLMYNPTNGWGYNGNNKLREDIVIVDEISMVDVDLFMHLVDAIDFTTTKLLMIGDDSQLPSVGCGNILHDFIESKIIPTVTLTKIFRYGDGGLMKVATDIRTGKKYLDNSMKNKATAFGKNKDYVFIDMKQEESLKKAVELYKKLLENGNTVNDIQVITPKNKGNYGTTVLNKMLQKVANPNYGKSKYIKVFDNLYFVGDLVMQCKNNYDAYMPMMYMSADERAAYCCSDDLPTAFVANGDSGTILKIENDNVYIDFGGVVVRYDADMMKDIKLGYAITCHKSQGSSVNNAILITPRADTYTLNSNLLYVGCTRAKNKCFHLGSVDTVNKVIKKKANLTRNTFMQQMLKELNCGDNMDK